jgi:uncharacterized protein YpmS
MGVKKNIWKIAFISIVCSLGLLFISLLIWFYFFFSSPDIVQLEREHRVGETMFVISTTKDQLNSFLAEQISSDGNNNFQITLTSEHVLLEAAIPLFGRKIAFELFLEPEIYGEGDLLLKSKSFHIGGFQLPSETLFSLIKNTLPFPDWIKINTSEETIILKVTEMEGLESMFIKVTKFDLEMDNIEFELVSSKK